MRKRLVILMAVVWGVAVLASRAEESVPAAADTNAAPEEAAAMTRDPFWPLGYTPQSDYRAPDAAGEGPKAGLQISNLSAEQQAALSRKLRVSGIMKAGTGYLARLNNQLVGAGDEITLDFEGQSLTLLVRSISKDSVQIEPKP